MNKIGLCISYCNVCSKEFNLYQYWKHKCKKKDIKNYEKIKKLNKGA